MGTAILHNRVIRKAGGGMPEYTYDGTHTVIDDGSTSGTWQIGLTSTGTLTLASAAKGITIQGQGGGGGGGAGYASGSGSDGADGSIDSYEGTLATGTYAVEIGAAGSKGNGGAGGAGGTTTFADILSAPGGAGGAHKGGESMMHTGLYNTYGQGGVGGTQSMYTGSYSAASYCIKLNAATVYSTPDTGGTVVVSNSYTTYVLGTTTYPSTITGEDGNTFYKIMTGHYVLTSQCDPPYLRAASDNRKWYGNAGYSGIVILSGKV